jgi:hypothetical protein
METSALHSFHIPVMGLAYTIDTPVKVARYGINSVVSIIEDKLIELMRKHYYEQCNLPYRAITSQEYDYRAKRITDYLDLLNSIVKDQFEKLKNTAFVAGSEISKYFEMLPNGNVLRLAYEKMVASECNQEKEALTRFLRSQIRPGQIDVNIMTKVDKNNLNKNGDPIPDSSDALAALRGYANSSLTDSSIIFSAGLNPRLYNYLETLSAFNAKGFGQFDKKIIIKVSDYRSALIQGKYLAKKGLWVSEFRIESGLNCGGHAFATAGLLLGPILEEFKTKKEELIASLHSLYNPAAKAKGQLTYDEPHSIKVSVQGGIGTYDEASFLTSHYGTSSTGWGTPFLLCPEATTVDKETLQLLKNAADDDLVLSSNSPLGVRFNYLKGTSAEKEKLSRIAKGKPGSPCTEKHLVSNTEFTSEPICTASYTYQKHKIEQLKGMGLSNLDYEKKYNELVAKECLCIGLSNAAVLHYNLPPIKNLKSVTVCPGPNIAYFDKIVTLQEMTNHIYGRTNILADNERPHMFIKELQLNVEYLREQLADLKGSDTRQIKDALDFGKQLLCGIEYYRTILHQLPDPDRFANQLTECETEIKKIALQLSERQKGAQLN